MRALLACAVAVFGAGCGAPAVTQPPARHATDSANPSPPPSPTPPPTPAGAAISLHATGLGPCDVTFPYACEYVIRLDGPGGYEHYGWFDWDGATKQPMSSTRVLGDLPTRLGPGIWTFSFGLVHRGDLVSYVPVPDGTPRSEGLDRREVGCSQRLDVTDELSDGIEVAFSGDRCQVLVATAMP